ncbi:MAG: hypothetical protein V4671_19485 [Armatimonadota bacterium]
MLSGRNQEPGYVQALYMRCLLQEILDLGCSRDKRGVALYEQAKRLLASPGTTDHDVRMHLAAIFRYAEARQQRLPRPFTPRVIAVYERLEAFLYPDAPLDSGASKEDSLVSVR